ncbi:uncharacterized protein LOC142097166 [Mixophyes fleayi]|uniref:uncharacterized protein LOC142097166 n=1 Tax=Mixophyes fleayi TaxID=3061075 RepID=UPI003F4DDD60
MNEYEKGEIFAQLGNLLPLDEKVHFKEDKDAKTDFTLGDRMIQSEYLVKSSDFIFPIFVYSVKRGINPSEVEDLKILLTTVRQLTGIFPVVVLTHKTNTNLKAVKSFFKNMGAEQIFPLENFTPEDHLKTRGRHEEVLRFFLEVIKDIEFRMERIRDPQRERQDRKTFVFNFVHEREMKIQKDEMENQLRKKERELEEANKKCVLQ